MTINEIRNNGVGVIEESVIVTTKTCKKKWETESGWYQEVVVTDDTGDLLAIFGLGGTYVPMQRNAQVLISASILDQRDGNVVLVVNRTHWDYYNTTSEPPERKSESLTEDGWADHLNIQTRGKIKCLYIAALLRNNDMSMQDTVEIAKSFEMKELIDETMKG